MKSFNYGLLFLGCLIFHSIGTGTLPLIDRDEPRFAEAAREMIERHDYVVPYFNGQFRFDKPPLTYWAQAASYRIFGENDFAARFPSAIAAALVAVTLALWGRQIGGKTVGLWAAIIFTLSLQTFLHAKAAVADMWLVLFVTTAHWAGWALFVGKRSTLIAERPSSNSDTLGWWLCFYVSLALGFSAKGPIAWTALLTLAGMKYFAREIEIGRRFKFVRGILLMLAIVSLWATPALVRTHGEFFRVGIGRHVIGRSIGAMEGHGANSLGIYLLLLPFYFITIFASFFPWSIKLPWLVRRTWRNRDWTDNYLIVSGAIIFLIFSLIKTKLPHYTLPAFPLLSLLLARKLSPPDNFDSRQLGGFNPSSLKRVAVATAVALGAIAIMLPPFIARSFPAYALFRQSRDSLRPEMEFGAIGFEEPSLVWYFRSRVRGFMTPLNKKRAADFMSSSGGRFVVLPSEMVADVFPNLPLDWKSFSTSGFNVAKGKKVELTLVLKEH